MKRNVLRIFALLLGLLLLLPGCAPQAELADLVREPYIWPELTFGIMEAPKLEQDPNLNRLTVTSGCGVAETEAGLYLYRNQLLSYADKTNFDLWVPACSTPKCEHKTSGTQICTAHLNGKRFLIENDRIHYIDNAMKYPELTFTTDNGFAMYSITLNGSDRKLERLLEDTLFTNTGGGSAFTLLFPDHIIHLAWELTKEGNEERSILYIDSTGTETLYETVALPEPIAGYGVEARDWYAVYGGEDAFFTSMIGNGFQTLCWIDDGKLVSADISELQVVGSYFSNNILRCFRQNDGYYDVNMLTGETTKLAQPQLKNSNVRILQPNCILESTLMNASAMEKRVGIEQHSLRLFDGTEWLDVSLPEELLHAPNSVYLFPMGIGTDAIYFHSAKIENMAGSEITLYKLVIGTDSPVLEYCGKIS